MIRGENVEKVQKLGTKRLKLDRYLEQWGMVQLFAAGANAAVGDWATGKPPASDANEEVEWAMVRAEFAALCDLWVDRVTWRVNFRLAVFEAAQDQTWRFEARAQEALNPEGIVLDEKTLVSLERLRTALKPAEAQETTSNEGADTEAHQEVST